MSVKARIAPNEFKDALATIELVPPRPGIPASEYIRTTVNKQTMTMQLASDMLGEVTLSFKGEWPVESPFYIDRRMLLPFVNAGARFKADYICTAVEVKKKKSKTIQLQIKHGKRKATFTPVPDIAGYAPIKVPKKAQTVRFNEEQKALVRSAQYCATPDPAMPHLNCVFLSAKGIVLSTNDVVIMRGETKPFKDSMPLPLLVLQLLIHPELESIKVCKDRVILRFPYGRILQTIPQKAADDFPHANILSGLKKLGKYPSVFKLNSVRLNKMLLRFANYMSAIRKQDRMIRLRSSDRKEIELTTTVSMVTLSERLSTIGKPSGTVDCEWPLDSIIPIIQFAASNKAEIDVHYSDDNQSPYLLKMGHIQLVLSRKVSE